MRCHSGGLGAEQDKASDTWLEQGWLFPAVGGTALEPRNLVRHFKSALVKAGLPTTTRFHDLRHWCASLLIAYDVHPKAIQRILGHANITTTLNFYGHLLPKVLQSATDRMGALAPDNKSDKDDSDEPTEWLWLHDWLHARESPPIARRALAF